MSVPRRSPLHQQVENIGFPYFCYSRDMWKCDRDTVKKKWVVCYTCQIAKLSLRCLQSLNLTTSSAAILRDFLKVWKWQRQKQRNSAWRPQVLNLAIAKNNGILRDFLNLQTWQQRNWSKNLQDLLQTWVLECRADSLIQCVLWFSATKNGCQVILSAASVTLNHLGKPTDLMLPNGSVSKIQRPSLLTSLMNMSLVLRMPSEMHFSRSPQPAHYVYFFVDRDDGSKPAKIPLVEKSYGIVDLFAFAEKFGAEALSDVTFVIVEGSR